MILKYIVMRTTGKMDITMVGLVTLFSDIYTTTKKDLLYFRVGFIMEGEIHENYT
jgi:hypothetical protein